MELTLENYIPVGHTIVLSPYVARKSNIYTPENIQGKRENIDYFKVEKTGENCEIVKPGDLVVLSQGFFAELPFKLKDGSLLFTTYEQSVLGYLRE